MICASLEDLTNGIYFEKSELAIAIARRVKEQDKGADLSLAIAIVKEVDHWLSTNSGKLVNQIRWIWKTYKDWWQNHFPYQSEYRVRRVLDALREANILLFEQWDKRTKLKPKAYWRLNYDLLSNLTQRGDRTNEVQPLTEPDSEVNTTPHSAVWTVHTDTTTTYSTTTVQIPSPTPPREGKEGEIGEKSSPREEESQEEGNTSSTYWEVQSENKQNQKTMPLNQEDQSSAAPRAKSERVQVLDPKLGFGNGQNFRLESMRERAMRSVMPTYSEQEKEFSRKFVEWELLQGVPSRYSRLSSVMDNIRTGLYVLEWDEFEQGLPLGTLGKKDWEIYRGIPHPMLVEYLGRQLQKAGESPEQGLNNARLQFTNPAIAQQHFDSWGRRIVNAKEESDRLRAMGVKGDTIPVDLKPRHAPDLVEVATAYTEMMVSAPTLSGVQANPQLPQVEEASATLVLVKPSVPDDGRATYLERLQGQLEPMREHLQSGKEMRCAIALAWAEAHPDFIEILRDENDNPIDFDWKF